jgi:glycosyltransferase involved in cell wall biosynthesis
MKIVHALGWYYPDSLGGTEIYVAGLCRRARAAGHDVYVAAPEAGRRGVFEYEHEGVPVFRYPIPALPSRGEAQGVVVTRGAELFHRWLGRIAPEVLHVHSLVTGLGVHELKAAKQLGIKVVLTHHLPALGYVCRLGTLMERNASPCDGVASPRRCAACLLAVRGAPAVVAKAIASLPLPMSEAFSSIPGPLGTGLGLAASIALDGVRQRELAELVDRQVVLNESAKRIIVANGVPADRIVLNRLGTDHRDVAAKPSVREAATRSPIRVGYVGRIDRTKGIVELVRAVTQLPRNIPCSLEIRGPVRTASERLLVEELRAFAAGDSRVSFRPAIPSCEVPAVLAGFDVLCCPSTWFENGPTVALEAMAVGTPLIATRLGNLAEIVEDGVNGRLVPPGDVDALSEAIREAAEDPAHTIDVWRQHLGAVRSLDRIAADYLELYAAS